MLGGQDLDLVFLLGDQDEEPLSAACAAHVLGRGVERSASSSESIVSIVVVIPVSRSI